MNEIIWNNFSSNGRRISQILFSQLGRAAQLHGRQQHAAKNDQLGSAESKSVSAVRPERARAHCARHLHGQDGPRGNVPLQSAHQNRRVNVLLTFKIDSIDIRILMDFIFFITNNLLIISLCFLNINLNWLKLIYIYLHFTNL